MLRIPCHSERSLARLFAPKGAEGPASLWCPLRRELCLVLFAITFAPAASRAATPVKSPVPIDFSYAGYEAGHPAPWVKAVLAVKPSGGDDTALLQGAIDRISAMSPGSDGFRGALLLAPGRFHVKGQLHLRVSGVVLRGSGTGPTGTVIVADGIDRRSLIVVGTSDDPSLAPAVSVQDDAPAGAQTLHLASVAGLKVGDHVVVRRPSIAAWNDAMLMTGLPGKFADMRIDWKPGQHDLVWDRTLTSVDSKNNTVQLDAPITTALQKQFGGGTLALVTGNLPPERIGIEDLTLDSSFDPARPKDEDHSWIAILMNDVQDAWARNVTARHFAASLVHINLRARRITVENCRFEAPISEVGGYRRQSFLVDGQQVLVYRCHSEKGMNDFASGLLAGGPNVFLDCDTTGSLEASGSFEGWSSGVLYENVHIPDARLQLILDFDRAQGAGWTAANSIIWNSSAQSVDALGPPGAPNFVVNSPQPLYTTELAARGLRLSAAEPPHTQQGQNLPQFRPADIKPEAQRPPVFDPVEIVNGRFVRDGKIVWGPTQGEAWWHGDTSIYTAGRDSGSSVSRYMPGVTAPGETENLQQFVSRILKRGSIAIQVEPGLWYDHRRDSHTVERRETGDVWAPFFEVPWARSGKGVAWDGLSKFDLTRYNPFYFLRERQFALDASKAGLIVFYNLYNTHNVLEIGPHWIDYAWRPANNINDTGLPEPPPLRVFGRSDEGNQFYSTAYAPLRALHRAYILHTLDELGDLPNVIFGVAYQYAGPLQFEQFFQDTVRDWEQQHHRHVRIALVTSKQTTDAILADPIRSQQIAVVDMRYWEYLPDGKLFAPPAGTNHAFRELISEAFPGYTNTPPPTTPQMVYREVREYRDRYSNIALMPMEDGAGPIPILMAGAASESGLRTQAPAPVPTSEEQAASMFPHAAASVKAPTGPDSDSITSRFVQSYLETSLMKMSPKDGWVAAPDRTWVLAGSAADPVLIYSFSGDDISLTRTLPASRYKVLWFNPRNGDQQDAGTISGNDTTPLKKPDSNDWLLLLRPQN